MNVVIIALILLAALLFLIDRRRSRSSGPRPPKEVLQVALQAALRGEIERALLMLEPLACAEISDHFLYYLYGVLLYKAERLSQATRIFQNILYSPSAPEHLKDDIRRYLGDLYLGNGQLEQARSVIEELLRQATTDDLCTLLQIYKKLGLYDQALALLPRLPTELAAQQRALTRLEQGKRSLAQGDTSDAVKYLREAIRNLPPDPEIYRTLIGIHQTEKRNEKVIETIAELLQHLPQAITLVYSDLEQACYHNNDVYEVDRVLKGALKGDEGDKHLYLYRARFAYKQRKTDDALFQLRHATELDPQFLPARLELFRIFIAERDDKNLFDELQRYVAEQPPIPPPLSP